MSSFFLTKRQEDQARGLSLRRSQKQKYRVISSHYEGSITDENILTVLSKKDYNFTINKCKIIAYLRQSTPDQASISTQLKNILQRIREDRSEGSNGSNGSNGVSIVVFIVRASAWKLTNFKKMPDFEHMANLVSSMNSPPTIYVFEVSRFMRSVLSACVMLKYVFKDCVIRSVMDSKEYGNGDLQDCDFLETLVNSQRESSILSARVKAGYKSKKAEGNVYGNPYGYKGTIVDNKRQLTPVDREQQIGGYIKHLTGGKRCTIAKARDIAGKLRRKGVLKRGKLWTSAGVQGLSTKLKNFKSLRILRSDMNMADLSAEIDKLEREEIRRQRKKQSENEDYWLVCKNCNKGRKVQKQFFVNQRNVFVCDNFPPLSCEIPEEPAYAETAQEESTLPPDLSETSSSSSSASGPASLENVRR